MIESDEAEEIVSELRELAKEAREYHHKDTTGRDSRKLAEGNIEAYQRAATIVENADD